MPGLRAAERELSQQIGSRLGGDRLPTQLAILRRVAEFTAGNVAALSRTVAHHCIQLEQ
jgi:hypothetical protein